MYLFALLFLPLGIGLAGLALGRGRINWKEFLASEAAMIVLITIAYFIAVDARTSDKEIWNGTVASKDKVRVNCCHSYSCDCHQVCTGSGSKRSCHTECDTCYRHGPRMTGWDGDVAWRAYSSNGERVFYDGCNAPYASEPGRWTAIKIGEPTAVEHEYTNYIKGNPDSILRRQGAKEKFKGRLPGYPRVYDYYRANRFLAVGLRVPDSAALNARLSAINGRLGAAKQVNIIVVVVNEGDESYLEALRETWLGGKKNDFVVVIGAPDFPAIAWAGVLSWTRNEDLKIDVRNDLLDLPAFDGGKVLDIVEREVQAKFVRRPMSDFDYLKSTIEPSSGVGWTIGILGVLLAIALQIYFWYADPFDSDHASYRTARRLRFT